MKHFHNKDKLCEIAFIRYKLLMFGDKLDHH